MLLFGTLHDGSLFNVTSQKSEDAATGTCSPPQRPWKTLFDFPQSKEIRCPNDFLTREQWTLNRIIFTKHTTTSTAFITPNSAAVSAEWFSWSKTAQNTAASNAVLFKSSPMQTDLCCLTIQLHAIEKKSAKYIARGTHKNILQKDSCSILGSSACTAYKTTGPKFNTVVSPGKLNCRHVWKQCTFAHHVNTSQR